MRNSTLVVITTLIGSLWFSSANATAWVNVKTELSYQLEGYYDGTGGFQPLPDGIEITDAGTGGPGTFGGSITSGHLEGHESITSPLTITNNSSSTFDGFIVYETHLSSFNPGGNPIGASVDDPRTEFASFYSRVQIFDFVDQHGCETSLAELACGVASPDDNSEEQYFSIPTPGNSETAYSSFQYDYVLDVHPAPEAPTIMLFAGALLILGAAATRNQPSTSALRQR